MFLRKFAIDTQAEEAFRQVGGATGFGRTRGKQKVQGFVVGPTAMIRRNRGQHIKTSKHPRRYEHYF